MKHARKLLMLVMATFMALVVATPAFADDAPTGSVTVSNANAGQTYTLYKLFDAEPGANGTILYKVPTGKTLADDNAWFRVTNEGYVVARDGVDADWAKAPEAIAWAKSFGTKVGDSITPTVDAPTVKWENVAYGYYFVDSSLGSFIGVDSTTPNASIQDKNEGTPVVDKTIEGVNGANNGTISEDKEQAIAQVGDTINYKVVVTAKAGAENYKVTDVMTGLAMDASSFKIDGTAYDAYTNVDKTASTLGEGGYTLVFTKAYLDTITADTNIVITYNAKITTAAVIGETGNPNKVTLSYGHKQGEDGEPGNTTDDEVKVYTAKITVTKHNGDGEGLAGAEFALKNADGKFYKYDETAENPVSWVDAEGDATKFTSNAQGALSGEFKGLSNGVYTLVETVVPTGYNKAADTTITIADKDYTNTNLTQSSTVVNNKGTELPETGGMGTTILYIVGGILLAGGAIVLISKRRVAEMEK